jgi:NADH dehydrogenase
MRVAITGGTGFVGGHLAKRLVAGGHEVVLIARGVDQREPEIYKLKNAVFFAADLSKVEELEKAFTGCAAVVHCAGINREIGTQTYERVHVEGTQNVVEAARRVGVCKLALLSFLRARPNCGSGYHESKWAAEEIVRASGLDYTIFKAGVIYGLGDHMLDHLSHALHTFPLFALVGMKDRPVRPLAVEDLAEIIEISLTESPLSQKTIAVMGPEEILLGEAVRRVGATVGKRPMMIRLPVVIHRVIAWFAEITMKIPLVSQAQVRILSEGIVEPAMACDFLPADLQPTTRFTQDQIRKGLPKAGGFGIADLRCCLKS